jgi:hypothetical protein
MVMVVEKSGCVEQGRKGKKEVRVDVEAAAQVEVRVKVEKGRSLIRGAG